MDNEVVYEAPANTTNNQSFVFSIQHRVGALWVESLSSTPFAYGGGKLRKTWQESHRTYWRFSVNMSLVKHPN